MKRGKKYVAVWGVIASMLFLTSALPSAYGLEFPTTSQILIEPEIASNALAAQAAPALSAAALYGSIDLSSSASISSGRRRATGTTRLATPVQVHME
ncbi:MAG: hypothetical protein RIQ73_577 [Actinomycetota bacterium]